MTLRALAFLALTVSTRGAAQPASFEAATIREITVDPDTIPSYKTDPGRITYRNVTLRDCLRLAWNMQDFQIEAPNSIDAFRFDLTATTSAPATEAEMRPLLRKLLIERFSMKVREETRELPGFLLTARGKTKLTPSDPNREFGREWSQGKMSFQHVTMEQFAGVLSGYTGRHVSDNTGLTDYYDFSLVVSDDPADAKGIMRGNEVGDVIVSTIQSQLGLRLEPHKSPTRMLIVDRAEKVPFEN